MGINDSRKIIMDKFVRNAIVKKMTSKHIKAVDERYKKTIDDINQEDMSSEEKEKEILKLNKNTIKYKKNIYEKYSGFLCGVVKEKEDDMGKLSTRIICDVLQDTLEEFAADLQIKKEQIKIDGRGSRELDHSNFNYFYKSFLRQVFSKIDKEEEKKIFNLFKRNWGSKGKSEWFFSYSTSVELVIALAEYYMSCYRMIGLNKEAKKKFINDYSNYDEIYDMRNITGIYHWKYKSLIKEILIAAKDYNIEFYNDPKNLEEKKTYDKYMKDLDGNSKFEKKYFMSEILDVSNSMEHIKSFIYDTFKLDKYYEADKYVYDTSYEILTDFNEDLFDLIGEYRCRLEQKESDFARAYIKNNQNILNIFLNILLDEEDIIIPNSFRDAICCSLEVKYNYDAEENLKCDIEKIRSAVYSGYDKKIGTVKNNFIMMGIIAGDVQWKSILRDVVNLYNNLYSRFIVDTCSDYIKKEQLKLLRLENE